MNFTDALLRVATARGSGASEPDVRLLEADIGTLPGEIRHYLRELGWATIDDVELLGLGEGADKANHLASVIGLERAARPHPLPSGFIPLTRDGAGGFTGTLLDYGSRPAVLHWDHEPDGKRLEVVAHTLAEWVNDLAESRARSPQVADEESAWVRIGRAAEALDASFPSEYVAFAARNPNWSSPGFRVWTVGSHNDVVTANKRLRDELPLRQLGLIAVAEDAMGGLYCVSGSDASNQQVVYLDRDATQSIDLVSDSFSRWVEDLIYASEHAR
jgi:hypothetical protein